MELAVCATHPNKDMWFADKPGVAGQRQVEAARRICETQCPVQAKCHQHRKDTHSAYGVWGGKTPRPPRERKPR